MPKSRQQIQMNFYPNPDGPTPLSVLFRRVQNNKRSSEKTRLETAILATEPFATNNYTFTPLPVFIVPTIVMVPWNTN
jgi:hypothetical protein